jgi:hypothetical protein
VSCELVLTEVPRAIRRAGAHDPELPLDVLIDRAGELRDAIHVAAAIDLSPPDALVGYDERQAAAARLDGLRTVSPGA